ncbi:hypothetical protein [Streptomyces sp. BSE7-9]|uniref:hypothetical protein n=1 Tax=Streptomyces sp. BSE7-9 TaxID=2759948 RepID=UPI0018EEC435|nr:hypothetical protein [Streptomyces sp. BSE7-9]MBJ6643073.1 hypothetical protein [Streptomyces sp. BSE7-9]
MVVARIVVGAGSVLAMLSLSGCGFLWNCTDSTAERGEADARVEIVDEGGRPVGVTAEVTGWRREPNPQLPEDGDEIHFGIRFEGDGRGRDPAVDACAVDEERVVLGCQTVYSHMDSGRDVTDTGHEYIDADRPERVAEVLLIPNDQSTLDRRTCEDDMKDGGGVHPPDTPTPGDQL